MKDSYGAALGPDQFGPNVASGYKEVRHEQCADINLLLEKVLWELCNLSARSMIRCDDLPLVAGDPDRLHRALAYLVEFILSNPPEDSAIFMHVRCEPIPADYIDLSMASGERRFRITFHTNSPQNPSAMPEDRKNFCISVVTEIGGTLSLNADEGTGWLFNLEVPGKLK